MPCSSWNKRSEGTGTPMSLRVSSSFHGPAGRGSVHGRDRPIVGQRRMVGRPRRGARGGRGQVAGDEPQPARRGSAGRGPERGTEHARRDTRWRLEPAQLDDALADAQRSWLAALGAARIRARAWARAAWRPHRVRAESSAARPRARRRRWGWTGRAGRHARHRRLRPGGRPASPLTATALSTGAIDVRRDHRRGRRRSPDESARSRR